MTRPVLGVFCVVFLGLAACAPPAADPRKAAADRVGVERTQPPAADPVPADRGGGGGDGGAGY